jgi:hypothetical protein
VTVTCIFDSPEEAREAIHALQAGGVNRRAISVITRAPDDARSLERETGASDDLEYVSVDRNRFSRFFDWIGKVESVTVPSFGSIFSTGDLWQDVALSGTGRGAITGALVGAGVPVDEASGLEQSVLEGKILVVVHGKYNPETVSRVLQVAE